MTISDWLMILAVLSGPIIAVQVQKWIEANNAKRNRQLSVFKTLMATRGAPLSYNHVEALNMIDLEFQPEDKYQNIIGCWRIYLDHLASCPQNQMDQSYQVHFAQWASKNNELLTDLLYVLAQYFHYKFDKLTLKKGIYVPKGHSDVEVEQRLLREGLIKILWGQSAIPVVVHQNNQINQNPR